MSATPIAVCIDPARVNEIWPHVAPDIRRAMERGDLGTFAAFEADVLATDIRPKTVVGQHARHKQTIGAVGGDTTLLQRL